MYGQSVRAARMTNFRAFSDKKGGAESLFPVVSAATPLLPDLLCLDYSAIGRICQLSCENSAYHNIL